MENWLIKSIDPKKLLSKSAQKDIVEEINFLICDGDIDPLMVDIILKSWENIITGVRKNSQVKDLILDEANKYEGKVFDRFGAKITLSSKTTWSYKKDVMWQELKKLVKERELLLKALKKDMVDPKTGEMATKPTFQITEFLKIEFK